MAPPKIDYESSEKWTDVVPVPQNEGGPDPLAAIAYTDEYAQATSYLRAVMASNEMSERVLELTEHVIGMNPAHYTVWLYRAATLKHLGADSQTEIQWLNTISLKHLKNYQIWHHRQVIMSQLSSLPTTELPFLSRMLTKDVKNYHVWSYRQWLVRHFGLWPTIEQPGPELKFTENLIESDMRNNSAWNHRFFVIFGMNHVDDPYKFDPKNIPDLVWDREVTFSKAKIARAPQNASAWNYLTGVLRKRGVSLDVVKEFALGFADIDKADDVRSSFALDVLADIWSSEQETEKARKALELLAERFDPIRKNYWSWRAQGLEVTAT